MEGFELGVPEPVAGARRAVAAARQDRTVGTAHDGADGRVAGVEGGARLAERGGHQRVGRRRGQAGVSGRGICQQPVETRGEVGGGAARRPGAGARQVLPGPDVGRHADERGAAAARRAAVVHGVADEHARRRRHAEVLGDDAHQVRRRLAGLHVRRRRDIVHVGAEVVAGAGEERVEVVLGRRRGKGGPVAGLAGLPHGAPRAVEHPERSVRRDLAEVLARRVAEGVAVLRLERRPEHVLYDVIGALADLAREAVARHRDAAAGGGARERLGVRVVGVDERAVEVEQEDGGGHVWAVRGPPHAWRRAQIPCAARRRSRMASVVRSTMR